MHTPALAIKDSQYKNHYSSHQSANRAHREHRKIRPVRIGAIIAIKGRHNHFTLRTFLLILQHNVVIRLRFLLSKYPLFHGIGDVLHLPCALLSYGIHCQSTEQESHHGTEHTRKNFRIHQMYFIIIHKVKKLHSRHTLMELLIRKRSDLHYQAV